ncbi:MAG: flavodoxin-dependent (E)-4-hydroxy-3-methylbut-2-enyl-diphosphate synthase [candidate division WOR-3 bacterium]
MPKVQRLAVRVGNLTIGGGAPVVVQSMTKTDTRDVKATIRQIRRLGRAGCELVRVAVPDGAAAQALKEIRSQVAVPLVADIHFDYRLALAAIKAGCEKVRINPGNIGASWKVEEIIRAAKDSGIAIRVGVNAGSIDKETLMRHRHPTAAALLDSMAKALEPFEKLEFKTLVLSAKTTSVPETVQVYRELYRRYPYPLHLGLTEAGLPLPGAVRSTAALSILLSQGIGDTIRVSLTGDPVLEVRAAYELLAALGLRRRGPVVYSCPTCGRTKIDVARIARQVERAVRGLSRPLRIAVMGCVVNGPGEAREADFGIAGGAGKGVVFAQGRVIKTCRESELVDELLKAIRTTSKVSCPKSKV